MSRVLPSAAMLDRALRCVAPWSVLALTLGCRPEPTTTAEPELTADVGGPTTAVDTEPAEPEPTEPEIVEPEPETEPELETEAEPEPVATAETGAAERKPLPKPIHALGDGSCVKRFNTGEKVKGFKLPSLAGDKTISPTGYRKRVMLLNFWATWCKPCLEELPEFDRLYRKYRNHGLTLVAVTTDEDPKPVQDFVDKHKLVAKIALAGEDAAGEYNRSGFPFSFVVDGEGTIIASFEFVNDACLGDLERVIREALDDLD